VDEGNDEAQSNLVRMVLNLAYLNEETVSNFTFNKETYRKCVGTSENTKKIN